MPALYTVHHPDGHLERFAHYAPALRLALVLHARTGAPVRVDVGTAESGAALLEELRPGLVRERPYCGAKHRENAASDASVALPSPTNTRPPCTTNA
jgi:hypothetical protein